MRGAGAFWLRSSGACFCSTIQYIQQYIFRLEKYVIDGSKKGFIYWGKHHHVRRSWRLLAWVIWRMLSQVTICILPYCICIWNYVLLFIFVLVFVFVLVLYLLVLGCSSSGHPLLPTQLPNYDCGSYILIRTFCWYSYWLFGPFVSIPYNIFKTHYYFPNLFLFALISPCTSVQELVHML